MTENQFSKILKEDEVHHLLDCMVTDKFSYWLGYMVDYAMNICKPLATIQPSSRNKLLGDIGEDISSKTLQYVMYNLGYYKNMDMKCRDRYCVEHNKFADNQNQTGIDLYLSTINQFDYEVNFMIEVKNWKRLNISRKMFEDEIADRYRHSTNEDRKLLIINKQNVPQIQNWCEEEGISIIPIRNHITNKLNNVGMEYSIKFLFRDLYNMIEQQIYDRNTGIRKAHELGLSVEIISTLFRISESRIYQILAK